MTNYMIGISWGVLSLFIWYGIIYIALSCCGVNEIIRREKGNLPYYGLIFVVFGLFILILVQRDHTVYYWDYSSYWKTSIDHCRLIFENPLFMIQQMFRSLNDAEYNNLIPSLIALPLKIFGKSYTMYVLLIYVMFFIPVNIVISLLLYKISYEHFGINIPIYWVSLLIISFPSMLYPVLYGYIDIAGATWVAVILLLVYSFDFEKCDIKKSVLLSISMIFLLLTRRYFAYFGVGITCGILAKVVIDLFLVSYEKRKEYIIGAIENLFMIGGVTGGILFVFLNKFLINSLFNNYRKAYSAYNMGNILYNYEQVVLWFGLILLFFALLGGIIGLIKKHLSGFVFAAILSLGIATILIFQVLTMGMHHYYIISIQIIVFEGMLFIWLYRSRKRLAGILIMAVCLNFIISFTGQGQNVIFSRFRYMPRIRNDLQQLTNLTNDAIEEAAGNKVVLTCSSDILNSDILRNLYLPYDMNYFPNLSYFCDVDLRDGFPIDIFEADIVIASSPTQYHLAPEGQRVIGFFNNELINDGFLSQHYCLLKEYNLDNGIVAKMYQKINDFTDNDRKYIAEYFEEYYSDSPELFYDRIIDN